MKILWLFAHPLHDSFHGSLLERGLAAARAAGHTVDLCDLYVEGFDPVLSAGERRGYHDLAVNRTGLEPWIERLRSAEWLVCQFPVGCFGPPAILKGFFDRIFLPGVAFDLSDPRRVQSKFTHWRRVTGIATYGQSRIAAWMMGDPPRRLVRGFLGWYAGRGSEVRHLALYRMNTVQPSGLRRFASQVERHFCT